MATEAARLRRPTESEERKTNLTHTGLLMEGLRLMICATSQGNSCGVTEPESVAQRANDPKPDTTQCRPSISRARRKPARAGCPPGLFGRCQRTPRQRKHRKHTGAEPFLSIHRSASRPCSSFLPAHKYWLRQLGQMDRDVEMHGLTSTFPRQQGPPGTSASLCRSIPGPNR